MIDTHTHLFSKKFDSDRHEVVERAIASGVSKMYLPNIDVDTVQSMLDLEKSFPGQCYSMLGLHPTSVKDDYQKQLDTLYDSLHTHAWAAIGEIGTDLYWDDSHWKEQQDAFCQQCEWALEIKKPIVVHCRESIDQTLALVEPYIKRGLTGVFHCFTGTVDQAKKAVELGLYLGIGGVVTYKKNGDLPEILKSVDRNRIVLETDSPYLAPSPKRGKRNESSYIRYVLDKCADILDIEPEEVEQLTDRNALRLFQVEEK